MLEHKSCDRADIKLFDIEGGAGGFIGYGSTFGNRDRAGEIVVPGAFRKALEAFLRDGFIAVGHDWAALPVATVKSAVEDEMGLRLEAEFHTTSRAQEARQTVRERLERGKSVGLSIGYRVLDAEDTDEGRLLKEIELHEVSLVTVPCNALAAVTGIKTSVECGLPADLPLADHASAVLAALEDSAALAREFAGRVKDLADLRAKEGRVLSAVNRERIARLGGMCREMADECESLVAAAVPKSAPDPQALAEVVRAELNRARLLGVAVA
jgi:HK97 family phage prohead protease